MDCAGFCLVFPHIDSAGVGYIMWNNMAHFYPATLVKNGNYVKSSNGYVA